MKILFAEDNEDLNNAVVKGLNARNYITDSVFDGNEALSKASYNDYDVIILDLNLPFMDGMEVAQEIRKNNSKVPLIALTARDNIKDKLKGFEYGFDDYITKPFEFEELVARVEALIRRSMPNNELILQCGNLLLDPDKRILTDGNTELELTKIEFSILEYLLRKKGMVVGNAELIEHIWSEEKDLIDPPIRSHIKNLRRKINDNDFQIIKTIPGVGYKID
jgi:DNA-binding response OmpR family regulator